VRFQRGILFLPESARICQHHFKQTLRGTAPSQPVGRTSTTPIEPPSTHLDRCSRCDHRILQPAQKRIDTTARFSLEHGRFRCPFAEQNKKHWNHPPSPNLGARDWFRIQNKRIGNSMTTNSKQAS